MMDIDTPRWVTVIGDGEKDMNQESDGEERSERAEGCLGRQEHILTQLA